jgi:tripartite-type tricarboxylate transporter receptor subunit TctC
MMSIAMHIRRMAVLAAISTATFAATAAAADPVESFYRGKTINMIVGTGESSGAVGAYPRAIAQVIEDYIPGHPNLIVRHMPGAGGIVAANYIYGIAPQDGLTWGFITRGFMLAPMMNRPQATFKPERFQWIGSPARTVSVGSVWTSATPVRTIEDAMKTQVVIGATTMAQDTGVYPTMLNHFLGTKFKIVSGYKSVGDVDLAMERGEVQGKVGTTWGSLNSGRSAEWVRDKKVTVLVQLGLTKAHDIPAEVPLALDYAKTPEDRQVMELICAPSETGYPSFMGPGVPKERVDAIRAAYVKTMSDPRFVAALKKQNLELDPIPAADIETVVKDLYALPEPVKQRARDLMPE